MAPLRRRLAAGAAAGASPMEGRGKPDDGALAGLAKRVQAAMLKSVSEPGENGR